jgi:adenylate kinase family enzyme
LDVDDYFWLPTDPPFCTKRSREERFARLQRDLEASKWVLSGSMVGWGDTLVHRFSLAVFLYVPQSLRLERLRDRERARYGQRIDAGGDMHRQHGEFIEWASAYDSPRADVRSKILHEAWIEKLTCRIVRADGALPIAELVDVVMKSRE